MVQAPGTRDLAHVTPGGCCVPRDKRSLDDYVEMTLQRTIDDRSADDAGFVEDIRLESANRQYVSGLGFGPTYSQTFPVDHFEHVFVEESEHRRVRIIEDGGFELFNPASTSRVTPR